MSRDKDRQEAVAARLQMMERIDPVGANLIREELSFWHKRSMEQAKTISKLLRKDMARA